MDGSTALTTPADVQIAPVPAAQATPWRLVRSALLWCLAAVAASGVAGFFCGFVLAILHQSHWPAKIALFAAAGMIATQTVFLWTALHKAGTADDVDPRSALGDGRIARPLVVAAIALVMALYATLLPLGVYQASPAMLKQVLVQPWWLMAITVSLAVIGAPFAEELFFRGWLWTRLRTHWGPLQTAVATSAIWFAIHFLNGIAPAILLLPLMIALPLARHFGGSVRASILVHGCNNVASAFLPWVAVWCGWLPWP